MSNIFQTLTNGIQDLSSILPLLGTEQCEERVGSALNNGYLYVAFTPISLFGSLGIVKASFTTLIASIVIPKYRMLGATMLAYTGFHPVGEVSQTIAVDYEKPQRFFAENQLERLLEDEHIDNIGALRLEGAPGCIKWNIFMTGFTLIIPLLFGVIPYLFIILQSKDSGTSKLVGFPLWTFPIIRIVCNVLCAIDIQFLIQLRILTIVKMRLVFLNVDRYAKDKGYSLSEHVHPWDKDVSSEMCIWALQSECRRRKLEAEIRKETVDPEQAEPDTLANLIEDIENFLRAQTLRQFHATSLFTKLRKSWATVFLSIILVVAIPGSLLGYIGCFNIVQFGEQSSVSTGILWLALEGALCLVRIIVWALNPVWDDCGGISFCMTLTKKSPLVTCDLYADEIESLGFAPVMREDDFLADVSAYSAPMTSFNWEGIALYYIFTGVSKDNESMRLYIIVSNYKEQTSRTFVRTNRGKFRAYVSNLVPYTRSYYSSITVHLQKTLQNGDNTDPREVDHLEHDDQFSDPIFVMNLKKHYEDILDKMERPKAAPANDEKRFKFRRGWSIGKVEEYDSEKKIPNWFPSAPRVSLFRRSATDSRTGENSQTEKAGADSIPLRLTNRDKTYIAFGQRLRRVKPVIENLERWVEKYLEILGKDLRLSLYIKRISSKKSGIGEKLLLMLDAYEDNEVEFLIMEARRQMELFLLRQLHRWRTALSKEQKEMTELVFAEFDKADKFWRERLGLRLSNEWKATLHRRSETRLSHMHERLNNQLIHVQTRIAEHENYDEGFAGTILDKWKNYLGLNEEYNAPEGGCGSNWQPESEWAIYEKFVSDRFEDRWKVFNSKLRAEKTNSTKEEQLLFQQLFQRIENISIRKVHLAFSMLQGQLEHFNEALDNTLGENPDDSPEVEKEKLRLVREHRFVEITHKSLDLFNGSVETICRILKQTQGISAIYFISGREGFTKSDFKVIAETVREIKTVTGLFLRDYPKRDGISQEARDNVDVNSQVGKNDNDDEISKAVKNNVNEILKTDSGVCLYEDMKIADHYRAGDPYLYFNDPGCSTCTVTFKVWKQEDHVLTLRHCFKGWWGKDGEIEVFLNKEKLHKTWGSVPAHDDFDDEDIRLPKEMFNKHSELNELVIKLKEGSYHLSDVFLPVTPVSESLSNFKKQRAPGRAIGQLY